MYILSVLRHASAIIVVCMLGLGLLWFGIYHGDAANNQDMYRYYQDNFYDEIGIQNAVAAILLSYRMYDTIFEAVIMLCSIIGIMHFLPVKWKTLKKGKGKDHVQK